MIPTMKKRGRTVLGVRMGLQVIRSVSRSGETQLVGGRGPLTAMLSIAAAGKRYL